jgi:hypothetical protein
MSKREGLGWAAGAARPCGEALNVRPLARRGGKKGGGSPSPDCRRGEGQTGSVTPSGSLAPVMKATASDIE